MTYYTDLKTFQRAHRDNFSESLALRTHRGLSWLNRAEQSEDDPDAKFIFLWIAFNAIYAQDFLCLGYAFPEACARSECLRTLPPQVARAVSMQRI